MNFQQAITVLTRNVENYFELRDEARDVVTNAVWAVATEEGDGKGEMHDWIANGDFTGTETPEWLADEWNEYQRNARALMED